VRITLETMAPKVGRQRENYTNCISRLVGLHHLLLWLLHHGDEAGAAVLRA
jgi:hypothetical protein